jgi:anti-sigma B factor antagonist
MEIQIEPRGDAIVVAIHGSVDGLTADTLLTTMQQEVEAGRTRVVADMEGVDYTSSAGLRALLATVKEARRRGGDLRLARIAPNVRKVLDLSGFTHILKVYDDVESAVASYAGSADR